MFDDDAATQAGIMLITLRSGLYPVGQDYLVTL